MKKNTKIILVTICILIVGVVGGIVALNHKTKPDNESQSKTTSVVSDTEKTENSQKKKLRKILNQREKKIRIKVQYIKT